MRPGSGTLHAQFDIYLNSCGMSSSQGGDNYGQPTPAGTFIENTVIIQYDPLVQEVGLLLALFTITKQFRV